MRRVVTIHTKSGAVFERKSRARAPGTGSIYKRGSVYWMAFRDGTGKVVQESCKNCNAEQARDKLNDRLAEVRNGTYVGPAVQKIKVSDLAKDLQDEYSANKRKSLDDLNTRWELHLEPYFGNRKAIEVTRPLLNQYVTKRLEEGASNATVNRELAALKRSFNIALENSKVQQVPKFPHLKESNVRQGFLSEHDYDKLAVACARQGTWMRGLFEAGYRLGWRINELLTLKVKQVDLLNRTIRLEVGTTKNDRGRTAPIDNNLYIWIQQCLLGKEDDDYVFTPDPDGQRRVSDIRTYWYKACVLAGLGRMLCTICSTPIMDGKCAKCDCERTLKQQKFQGPIFHDLRRTAVRNMTRAGIPERICMMISGHKTRSVFDRYDVTNEGDLKIAAERMNARAKVVTDSLTTVSSKPAPTPVQQAAVTQDELPN